MAFSFEFPSLLDVCSKFNCPPEVASLAAENLAPAEFINALQAEQKSVEAVQALSRMLPDEKSVEWAVESAKIGGESVALAEEELQALEAALDWANDPCKEAQAVVLDAVKELSPASPSYWAANAAAVSEVPAELTELGKVAEVTEAVGDASSQFAAGAVLLAANQVSTGTPVEIPEVAMEVAQDLPQAKSADIVTALEEMVDFEMPEIVEMTPKEIQEAAKLLEPFIENGKKIASTLPGWA